jgi:transcriptional regulator with XRE-family HTH domain
MEKIIGQALRKERESRGVSLADIAAETRIGTRMLQALEDEEFDLFPGKFYVHYYIKNYLRACGADETAFFNTYQDYLKNVFRRDDELQAEQYMQKMTYARFRRNRTILLAFLLLAVVALLAYLLLGPPHWLDKVRSGPPAVALAVPPFSSHMLRLEDESCLSVPPISARLEIDAPCWLQLWRGSEKIVEKTFRKGEGVSLHGYQLTLVISNPQALRLQLNDREVSYLRRSPAALKMVIDPGNLQEILNR